MINTYVQFKDSSDMTLSCEDAIMRKQLNIFRESLVKKLKKHKKDTEIQFLILMVDLALSQLEVL